MTPEKQLSESLLAACKAAGIENPRYIAQDEEDFIYHHQYKPTCEGYLTMWGNNQGIVTLLNHQPYAEDWRDSLLEWTEHVADTSKMIDDACEIAYHAHLENGNGFRWSRLDCYRAAWQDALAWKGSGDD